jgi:hypothetical protein
MFKISLTIVILLLLTTPAMAIDADKWNFVAHQEISPQQSFSVGEYTITLEDQEQNGVDDYTVIVNIEQNGNKQSELMRAGDSAYFDDDLYQIKYDGTSGGKQIFDVYHENPNNDGVEATQNVSETVTGESVNTPSQSEPTIPFDNSNLMAIGTLLLLVVVRKR